MKLYKIWTAVLILTVLDFVLTCTGINLGVFIEGNPIVQTLGLYTSFVLVLGVVIAVFSILPSIERTMQPKDLKILKAVFFVVFLIRLAAVTIEVYGLVLFH